MSASGYTLSITGRSPPDVTKAATPRSTEVSVLALKMRMCREPCTLEAAIEGVWSLLRRGPLANTAFTDDEHLERTLRRGLRHIQLRPDLIDGCLTGTGLTHRPADTNPKSSEVVLVNRVG